MHSLEHINTSDYQLECFLEIIVNIPEQRIALSKKYTDRYRYVATFDYLPGREFDVILKEFTTQADPATQTFAATFVMPAPKDVVLLPGMTPTIREYLKVDIVDVLAEGFPVPIETVPVDGVGQYYVWKVVQGAGDTWTVHRVDVRVGPMQKGTILVVEGLKQGDRIAAAGVHFLHEGQQVSLYTPPWLKEAP